MNPCGSSFEKLTWAFGPPAHDENQIEHSGISLHPKAHITANIFRTATGSAGSSGCAIPGAAHRRPRPAPAASRSSSHQGWSSAFAGTFRARSQLEPGQLVAIGQRPAPLPAPHRRWSRWSPQSAPASASRALLPLALHSCYRSPWRHPPAPAAKRARAVAQLAGSSRFFTFPPTSRHYLSPGLSESLPDRLIGWITPPDGVTANKNPVDTLLFRLVHVFVPVLPDAVSCW